MFAAAWPVWVAHRSAAVKNVEENKETHCFWETLPAVYAHGVSRPVGVVLAAVAPRPLLPLVRWSRRVQEVEWTRFLELRTVYAEHPREAVLAWLNAINSIGVEVVHPEHRELQIVARAAFKLNSKTTLSANDATMA